MDKCDSCKHRPTMSYSSSECNRCFNKERYCITQQETLLKDLGIKLNIIWGKAEELSEEWHDESEHCPYHSDTVGDCDHEDNNSSSMTSCNRRDCPLLK